ASGGSGTTRGGASRVAGSRDGPGSGSGERSAPGVPVHAPAPRRAVPSPVRVTARRADDGLFDAGSPRRVAPEDDARGYLRPVRVEVADEELYRLFDPKRTPAGDRQGSRSGPAR
ncbi:MAG TPA: hypothetical protein VF109_06970, partial [Mycobacteriales bacterium]